MSKIKSLIQIYTDGACSKNPGPGGWGAILKWQDITKKINGHSLNTTNNQMEITAAIEALSLIKGESIVEIYTDSTYLKEGITKWINNWQRNNWLTSNKKPVKNINLWQKLINLTKIHQVSWYWIKAHNGNQYNEIADQLAVEAKNQAIFELKNK